MAVLHVFSTSAWVQPEGRGRERERELHHAPQLPITRARADEGGTQLHGAGAAASGLGHHAGRNGQGDTGSATAHEQHAGQKGWHKRACVGSSAPACAAAPTGGRCIRYNTLRRSACGGASVQRLLAHSHRLALRTGQPPALAPLALLSLQTWKVPAGLDPRGRKRSAGPSLQVRNSITSRVWLTCGIAWNMYACMRRQGKRFAAAGWAASRMTS